jgi:hypothetical protein
MKVMKRVMMLILAIAVVTTGTGCAKKKGSASVPPVVCDRGDCSGVVPGLPGGGGGGPGSYGTASEVPLSITSLATFKDFFFQQPVYNPQNIRVGMAVGQEQSNQYGGEVWVSFEENGVTRSAVLTTYHPHGTGVSDSSKNLWFNNAATSYQNAWHGIFQDAYGAMVVVIDSAMGLGDGDPAAVVGGSIWYQNFGYTGAPQGPEKMCWQISIGPYDCRTFLSGGQVVTTSSLFPTTYGNNSNPPRQPYRKLGSFYNMPRAEAMGN